MITRLRATNFKALRNFDAAFESGVNILVGGNGAGKSTVLEAIEMALTGRHSGRPVVDALDPYWFNIQTIRDHFSNAATDPTDAPCIEIEVFLTETSDNVHMRGKQNSLQIDAVGVRMLVSLEPDFAVEYASFIEAQTVNHILPTELYRVDWHDFSGEPITRTRTLPRTQRIDSKTTARSTAIDRHLRDLVRNFVSPQEAAKFSLETRSTRLRIDSELLATVNERLDARNDNAHGISLRMDQSASAKWETQVAPHKADVPFPLLGQGEQLTTKLALALKSENSGAEVVCMEEPENHLAHTQLMSTISMIGELAANRQVFVTTHSPYVLNRLGFDKLRLIHGGKAASISTDSISKDTVDYFRNLAGYDTLRLVLSKRCVVVEGPSDEMIFNRAFYDRTGKSPAALGVDVLALGTQGKRALELAAALDKDLAVIRDNDGSNKEHWVSQASHLLLEGKREYFIGDPSQGYTLEPQIVSHNSRETVSAAVRLPDGQNLEEFMSKHKPEKAWRIANYPSDFVWPAYIEECISFVTQ